MGTMRERGFRRLAVIGAGNMGSGIAQKMAAEGFDVTLVDLDDEKVARGLGIVTKTLNEGVERKLFGAVEAQAILGRIRGTTDWDALADADLVVEAVFEDSEVKRRVFERLDEVCRPDSILATNTSSFLVSEIQRATRRPQRVLGLHYFYHPAKNRLVEIIAGRSTDPTVLRSAWSLQEQLGKTPIASADAPGFIVNRFFVPWLNEAVRIVEEDVASIATVEQACREHFGVGMGPFELMNLTGVPIALHAATTLGQSFGSFYAPARLLSRHVESGKLWELAGEADPLKFEAVAERLLAVVFYVASALVNEKVGTIEDTDIGARVGLRWPRGPFEMMNRKGLPESRRIVLGLTQRWNLALPEVLALQAEKNEPFGFASVKTELRDSIALLTVNRPDAMNALNEEVVSQLHRAFREAAANPAVRGIVLTGAGKAFIAGADVRFFVRHMQSGDLQRIVEFTRAGHALLDDIDRCSKPVVARLNGLALGGGVELALACDRIVASSKASVSFPETGIGIYPGLGGTQRVTRRIGVGLAKWLILSGETLSAEQAAGIGLIDRVAPPEDLDAAVREALDEGTRPPVPPRPPADYRSLEQFFATHTAADLLSGQAIPGADERIARAVRRAGAKAPVALRIAERLIEDGAERPLEQGLRMELDRLLEVFETEDAREGLSSVGKGKPIFKGR